MASKNPNIIVAKTKQGAITHIPLTNKEGVVVVRRRCN